jgi:hypothetical protein
MITTGNTLLEQPLYLTRQHPNFLFKSQDVLDGASAVQLSRTIPWDGLLKNLAWDGVYDKVFQERTFEVVGSQRSALQSYTLLAGIFRLKRQLFEIYPSPED